MHCRFRSCPWVAEGSPPHRSPTFPTVDALAARVAADLPRITLSAADCRPGGARTGRSSGPPQTGDCA